ncbi:methyl-accepting chemotaxis protein [Qipengyuania sp.]|uniref:methyl-accepting chemotaxis protein n=1 Tax=Qipengyuania sp. TaxID=2004515 RepID=UPI0035C7D5D5
MFKSLTIPRKLGFAFMAINATAAVMMILFFLKIGMVSETTEANNRHQDLYAQVQTLETSILRQNSQFRGFLVTGDESYLKSYYEGRDDYDKVSAELEAEFTNPEMLGLLKASREETLKWRANWGDRLIDKVRAGYRLEAGDEVRAAGKAVMVSDAVLPLRDIKEFEQAEIAANSQSQDAAISTARVTLVVGGLMLIAVAVSLAMALSRAIAKPVTALTNAMSDLAGGRSDVVVPSTDRSDEIGDMAKAVVVFRDAARAKASADHAQAHVVESLAEGLEAIAKGDLTYTISEPFDGSYDSLRTTFNHAVETLEESLRQVSHSAGIVSVSSSEIRVATEDLSRRTEQQASSLEQTTASSKQVTSAVAETADGTSQAQRAIELVEADAAKGGEVMGKAVEAMAAIEKSSVEIENITDVIDGIAFQTNLLALNAGVEAARAGESGKGFAVVANEVRALAQRSADAASSIKALISTSSEQVAQGVSMVGDTGKVLNNIAAKLTDVSGLMKTVVHATEGQAGSLAKVNDAVGEMDKMTQQNAAMVEQSTACARSLSDEAEQLARLVNQFSLRRDATVDHSRVATFRSPVSAPAPVRACVPAPVQGNLAVDFDDDWSEF